MRRGEEGGREKRSRGLLADPRKPPTLLLFRRESGCFQESGDGRVAVVSATLSCVASSSVLAALEPPRKNARRPRKGVIGYVLSRVGAAAPLSPLDISERQGGLGEGEGGLLEMPPLARCRQRQEVAPAADETGHGPASPALHSEAAAAAAAAAAAQRWL